MEMEKVDLQRHITGILAIQRQHALNQLIAISFRFFIERVCAFQTLLGVIAHFSLRTSEIPSYSKPVSPDAVQSPCSTVQLTRKATVFGVVLLEAYFPSYYLPPTTEFQSYLLS